MWLGSLASPDPTPLLNLAGGGLASPDPPFLQSGVGDLGSLDPHFLISGWRPSRPQAIRFLSPLEGHHPRHILSRDVRSEGGRGKSGGSTFCPRGLRVLKPGDLHRFLASWHAHKHTSPHDLQVEGVVGLIGYFSEADQPRPWWT